MSRKRAEHAFLLLEVALWCSYEAHIDRVDVHLYRVIYP